MVPRCLWEFWVWCAERQRMRLHGNKLHRGSRRVFHWENTRNRTDTRTHSSLHTHTHTHTHTQINVTPHCYYKFHFLLCLPQFTPSDAGSRECRPWSVVTGSVTDWTGRRSLSQQPTVWTIGGGSYWGGRAAARPLFGLSGPQLCLARPLLATWKHKM